MSATGATIRAAREARGMTQTTLARALGVTQSAVGQWERGLTTVDARHLAPLATLLALPVGLLVDGTGELDGLHPDAIELAVRASALDDRTRRALLAACDAWLAHAPMKDAPRV